MTRNRAVSSIAIAVLDDFGARVRDRRIANRNTAEILRGVCQLLEFLGDSAKLRHELAPICIGELLIRLCGTNLVACTLRVGDVQADRRAAVYGRIRPPVVGVSRNP